MASHVLWRFSSAGPERLEARDLPAADFRTLPIVPQIDGAMQAHLQDVVEAGAAQGRKLNVLAKAGDSITSSVTSNFLVPLGNAGYNPAFYGLSPDLIQTWSTYLAPIPGGNSYSRNSLSAFPGWQSGNLVSTVASEISATQAGVALLMIGTNDWAAANPDLYRSNLRQIIATYLSLGVVPIVSTIPDSYLSATTSAWVSVANQVIADVAEEMDVPLWNFWLATQTLPGHGIGDTIHPNTAPTGGGDFSAIGLAFGYNVRNLTALQALTKVREVVFEDATPDGAGVSGLTPWRPLDGLAFAATGSSRGDAPIVTISDPRTGEVLSRFLAYDAGFLGGVSVAVADVDGDGVPDIVTGAGRGGGPVVKVFSGTDGREIESFFAFEPTFSGGISVAAGDLDGDGIAEIVVGAGVGGGPRVRVFRGGTREVVQDFFAFEPTFLGGVRVAVGNFRGVGTGSDIVVTPGQGGGSLVKLFAGSDGSLVQVFEVFESAYRGGLTVAVTDANQDGSDDLVLGAASGSTRVRAISAGGADLANFFASGSSRQGVRVGSVFAGPGKVTAVTATSANLYNIQDLSEDVLPLHGVLV